MTRPPDTLPPLNTPAEEDENLQLANEFATPGTVMHFALRLGFMPHNEAGAEATIARCIQELHWYEARERD